MAANDGPMWGETQNDTYGLDFGTVETVDPVLQRMRNSGPAGVKGSLPLFSPDGSNCLRGSVGLNMNGSPYQGQYSIPYFGKLAEDLGDIFYPENADYAWKPRDLEIWNDGHAEIRTENGGRAQLGVSVNGFHETDNPNELFGESREMGPSYVVRLGDYDTTDNPEAKEKAIQNLYGGEHNMERYRMMPYLDGTVQHIRDPRYTEAVQERTNRSFEENFPLFYDSQDPYKRIGVSQKIKDKIKKVFDFRPDLEELFDAYMNIHQEQEGD